MPWHPDFAGVFALISLVIGFVTLACGLAFRGNPIQQGLWWLGGHRPPPSEKILLLYSTGSQERIMLATAWAPSRLRPAWAIAREQDLEEKHATKPHQPWWAKNPTRKDDEGLGFGASQAVHIVPTIAFQTSSVRRRVSSSASSASSSYYSLASNIRCWISPLATNPEEPTASADGQLDLEAGR